MHNRYPNRRWIFLTSGDAATGVNFNQVMETSPATCRYNIAPTPGTETFVKYSVTTYPLHTGNMPQIMVYSGWHQDSPADQPTWQTEEQYPEMAIQSGTYDTYKYDYEVTGSGAYLEWSKSAMTGGGWIDSLSIMVDGSGYSYDGNLTASGGGGNGFAGTFTQHSGLINSAHITNSGEYYTSNPTIIIDGDGSGGEIIASANPGQPTEPAITGTGYYPLYTDNILGSGFFAASGQVTGQPDCFDLALEVEASGGNVTSLGLVTGGAGYSSDGNLAAVGGGGHGFVGTFKQISGVVDSVSLVSGGYGYASEPTITLTSISGTNGTGALVSGVTNSWSASGCEFEHQDMLNILSGPDWTPTGMPF